MDTETTIEADLKISVNYGGVTPIGGGRMSFSPNHLSRIAPTNDNTFVRRILFADLVTDGVNKKFKMLYQVAGMTNHAGVTLTNPAGEDIMFSDTGRLLYLKSNTTMLVTMDSFAQSVDGNGAVLLDYGFIINEPTAGDPIMTLSWASTAITAVGSGNFYCDLILAVY